MIPMLLVTLKKMDFFSFSLYRKIALLVTNEYFRTEMTLICLYLSGLKISVLEIKRMDFDLQLELGLGLNTHKTFNW